MKINYEQAIAFFVLGAFSVYVVGRIMAPSIKQKIATSVTQEVIAKQRMAGLIILEDNQVYVDVGTPIASSVMRSLYLE